MKIQKESLETIPSRDHTSYVLHNVIDWERSYSPEDLTNVREVAIACHQYDNDYSVNDYIEAIEYYDMFNEDGKVSTILDEGWRRTVQEQEELILDAASDEKLKAHTLDILDKEELYDDPDNPESKKEDYFDCMDVLEHAPEEHKKILD